MSIHLYLQKPSISLKIVLIQCFELLLYID